MSDYDNTNKGVMFQPFQDWLLVLQGKLDIEGNESRVVAVRQKLTRDGEPVLMLYQQVGILYGNDKNGNDKAPDWSGKLDAREDLRIAGWKGQKDGKHYLQLKVSEKQQSGGNGSRSGDERRTDFPDDAIPF